MDNKTFLETFLDYLPHYRDNMRIYHESSIYFYGYQIPQKFLSYGIVSFYYLYWIGRLDMLEIKSKKGNKAILTVMKLNISVLNDFVTFRLKKKNDIWVFYAYRKEDLAVSTIKKYWKCYRLNYFRNKIQPLKRELIEYLYHPSRINFSI